MNDVRADRAPVLREAFYELSLASDVPNAETLDEVCRQYPQYSAELTLFAIDLALDALNCQGATEAGLAQVDPSQVSPAVSRAISKFHNQLHSAKKAHLGAITKTATFEQPVENPFAKLSRPQIRAVAARLDANTVFVLKLRDQQIIPDTISAGFLRCVAKELSVPDEVLARHFRGRSQSVQYTFHKADGKPSDGGQQSFEDAVRTSGLTEEQKKRLLNF
jgi:hypothetical protein